MWVASITATGQLKVSPMRNYTMVGVIQAYRKTRLIFVVMFSMFGAMKKMTLLKSVAAVAVTRTM